MHVLLFGGTVCYVVQVEVVAELLSLWTNAYAVKVVSALDRRNLKCDPNERKIETLVKQRSFLLSCLSCY